MDDFFKQAGPKAIGSRLRRLTDSLGQDAAEIYKLYQVDLQPKWFPVFHSLTERDMSITNIAQFIGHSHSSVSKIVSEMHAAGVVQDRKDAADGRKTVISLTPKGRELATQIQEQYIDLSNAVDAVLTQSRHNLWKAIEEWEHLLEQRSMLKRVQDLRKERLSKQIRIVEYDPQYATAFRELNEEWISAWFKMEESDYKALLHPEDYILQKGGAILVALDGESPVGVCALIRMDDPVHDFEMAKMAVSPGARGRNVGMLLGQAIIEKARKMGCRRLYLESSTILKPAISLYYKLGFQRIIGRVSPYERCDIQMELDLTAERKSND